MCERIADSQLPVDPPMLADIPAATRCLYCGGLLGKGAVPALMGTYDEEQTGRYPGCCCVECDRAYYRDAAYSLTLRLAAARLAGGLQRAIEQAYKRLHEQRPQDAVRVSVEFDNYFGGECKWRANACLQAEEHRPAVITGAEIRMDNGETFGTALADLVVLALAKHRLAIEEGKS